MAKDRSQAVRGFAAIGIVFCHIASHTRGLVSGGILSYYMIFLRSLGGIGVNLFFFYSGYGNQLSVQKSKNRIAWLWNRIWNLYLVFAVCYLLEIIPLLLVGTRIGAKEAVVDLLTLTMPLSVTWYTRFSSLCIS